MRSNLIVLPEPCIDDDLSLFDGVKLFCVQDFAAQTIQDNSDLLFVTTKYSTGGIDDTVVEEW